jgi:excisionase family DNA binding protein
MPVLPEYITLEEAARYYGVDPQALENLIAEGKIRAIKVGGRLAVVGEDILALQIPAPSEDMKGRPIKAKDAIEKYRIASHSTLAGWRERGIVKVIRRGHRNVLYDEYSIAMAAQLYHSKQAKEGIRYTCHSR